MSENDQIVKREIVYAVGTGFDSDDVQDNLTYATVRAEWDRNFIRSEYKLRELRIQSRVGDEILVGDIEAVGHLRRALQQIEDDHYYILRGAVPKKCTRS